jgi:ribosomal protein S18 acetylase RimI-like enzyme
MLQVDSYRTAYAGLLPEDYLAAFSYTEQEQDWRDLFASDQVECLYVAESDGGDLVGYALGQGAETENLPYQCELVALHVRPEFQRQGIGQQLFTAIAEWFAGQGIQSLFLWVLADNPARGFYEHLGGHKAGERRFAIDGLDVVEIAYGWCDSTTALAARF